MTTTVVFFASPMPMSRPGEHRVATGWSQSTCCKNQSGKTNGHPYDNVVYAADRSDGLGDPLDRNPRRAQ